MDEETEVSCPFCGASFPLFINLNARRQTFTSDCENCCRPIEFVVECESGELVSLEARPG